MTPQRRKTVEYWRARMPATFKALCETHAMITIVAQSDTERRALIDSVNLLCKTMAGEIDVLHAADEQKRTQALSSVLGSVFEGPPATGG
jgi:hypothetical protein